MMTSMAHPSSRAGSLNLVVRDPGPSREGRRYDDIDGSPIIMKLKKVWTMYKQRQRVTPGLEEKREIETVPSGGHQKYLFLILKPA